jgi:hypothetical protein
MGSLTLRAFIDSSHGVHNDGKGHQGLVVSLGLGPILTKSRKQKVQCKSSTEAELVALSDYIEDVEHIRDFLYEQNCKVKPAIIYQDNKSTLAKVEQDSLCGRDRKRHFKKRRLLVKESVDEKVIKLKYLPTDSMVADILTKPLQGSLFTRLTSAMTNYNHELFGGVSVNNDVYGTENVVINNDTSDTTRKK